MKRLIIVICLSFLILLSVHPVSVSAAGLEETEKGFISDADDILSGYDIDLTLGDTAGYSFSQLISEVMGKLRERAFQPVRIFSSAVVLSLIWKITEGLSGKYLSGSADINRLLTSLSAAAVTAVPLLNVYERVLDSIRLTSSFILVYIPVFSAITVFSGGITSAGTYHMMILGATELIVKLSDAFLLPLMSLCTVLALTGSLFENSAGQAIVGFLRKAINTAITYSSVLFSGFLTLRCSLAGRADSAADRTARMILSGSVPVIGGAVSEAYSTVKGSLGLIRSTIGTAGVIAVLLILLPPVAEIAVYRLAVWAGSAVADMFDASPVSSIMKCLDDGLSLAQCVLTALCGLLVICTAIFMNTLS